MTSPEPSHSPQATGASPVDVDSALRGHEGWLRAVVSSQVREPQAVEEILQEVALAAVGSAAALPETGRLGSWLYRVAVRQALLYRRRKERRHRLLERYADRVPAAVAAKESAYDPLGLVLADERRRLVRIAVARLSRKDAEVLLLKYSEGWSYREVAERLGVTEAAVEARLHRARSRLRAELAALQSMEVRQ